MTDELMQAYKGLEAKQAALEAKQAEEKKARQNKMDKVGNGCLIIIALFLGLIFLASLSPPTQDKLALEYRQFFEGPCILPRALARERGEAWSNQVRETIMGQVKGNFTLSERKEIYEVHKRDCSRLINSGTVLSMAEVKTVLERWRRSHIPTYRKQPEKTFIKRRTSTGVAIERGADIDYRIDSDKIINLSVNRIRSRGYSCNSVSRIQLYRYSERISVYCNGDKDRYWIKRDSAGLFRHVERL